MPAGVISSRSDYADDFMQISREVGCKTHATVAAYLRIANRMVVRRAAFRNWRSAGWRVSSRARRSGSPRGVEETIVEMARCGQETGSTSSLTAMPSSAVEGDG